MWLGLVALVLIFYRFHLGIISDKQLFYNFRQHPTSLEKHLNEKRSPVFGTEKAFNVSLVSRTNLSNAKFDITQRTRTDVGNEEEVMSSVSSYRGQRMIMK